MDQALRGVEWQTYGETVINPFVLAGVLLMGICLLCFKRQYAVYPLIIVALYCTSLQRIVIFSLDFMMIRVMILFGFIRILLKKEARLIKLNSIDTLIILSAFFSTLTYTLLWQTSEAFINRLGGAFNAIGIYFLLRIFIRNIDEAAQCVKFILLLSIPIACFMFFEKFTQRNLFGFMGGVPEITVVREGRLRCQGAFGHPILAGTFGASLMSLVIGYWLKHKKISFIVLAGGLSSIVITLTSASSGPVMTLMACLLGWGLWPLRGKMRPIFLGFLALLTVLHFSMKAPVWFLLGRVDIVGGSSSYHRSALIDSAIRNVSEWWLIGTYGSGHWGWGLEDVTNMFVRVAIDGGLSCLILFILTEYLCFRTIGAAIKKAPADSKTKKFIWAWGVYLFSHIISFIGVSYFEPNISFFYSMNIAIIASMWEVKFFKTTRQ